MSQWPLLSVLLVGWLQWDYLNTYSSWNCHSYMRNFPPSSRELRLKLSFCCCTNNTQALLMYRSKTNRHNQREILYVFTLSWWESIKHNNNNNNKLQNTAHTVWLIILMGQNNIILISQNNNSCVKYSIIAATDCHTVTIRATADANCPTQMRGHSWSGWFCAKSRCSNGSNGKKKEKSPAVKHTGSYRALPTSCSTFSPLTAYFTSLNAL